MSLRSITQLTTLAYLKVTKEGLQFNIFQLVTSHFLQRRSPLDGSLKKAIPSHLSHACTFWTEHQLSQLSVYLPLVNSVPTSNRYIVPIPPLLSTIKGGGGFNHPHLIKLGRRGSRP